MIFFMGYQKSKESVTPFFKIFLWLRKRINRPSFLSWLSFHLREAGAEEPCISLK
jgi:hypothetical protein